MKRLRLSDTEDHVTEEGVANGTRLVPEGTVLVLTRGSTLHNAVPISIAQRPMTFNQDVKALRPMETVDSAFLPYLVLGNRQRLLNLVDLAGHGAGRLNTQELRDLDISLPPMDEQRAIAEVLGALDDRIELNRCMSETLEEMARALFRSWFVDFDPVRAKAEGRPSGLPPALDALFPASFEASGLGTIPSGWAVSTVGEEVELVYGRALKSADRKPGSVAVMGSNGRIGQHDTALATGPGIVVGRKGNPGFVRWVSTDFWPIDTTFYVRPRTELTLEYLYQSLAGQNLAALAADSAVPGINRNFIYGNPIVVPRLELVSAFSDAVEPLWRLFAQNEVGSSTLAGLRDALLPELLSGRVRVRSR